MDEMKNFNRQFREVRLGMAMAQQPELKRRMNARLIDLGLFYVLYAVAYMGLVIAFNYYLSSSTYMYYLLAIAVNVAFALLYAVVEGILLGGTGGYTLGKWTMGVKVIDLENESGRLPWKKAFKRSFFFALLSGLGIPIIGWIVMGRTQARLAAGETAAWDSKCKTNAVMVKRHPAGVAIFVASLLLTLAMIFVCAAGVIPGIKLEAVRHPFVSSDGNFGASFFRMPKEETIPDKMEDGTPYITKNISNTIEAIQYEEIQSAEYKVNTEEARANYFNNVTEYIFTNLKAMGEDVKLKYPAKDITGTTSDGVSVPGREFVAACKDKTGNVDIWYRVYILPGDSLRTILLQYIYHVGTFKPDYDPDTIMKFFDSCFYK